MKESKRRDHLSIKKKKRGSSPINLDSWNQTSLEEESEQSLEMRRHLLKLQLAREGTSHSSAKRQKKKHIADNISSDSDSSRSGSSYSSASSSSVRKYKSKKSSSFSEDEKKKFLRGSLPKKKLSKETKVSRRSSDYKVDKIIIRRKASPITDKSSARGRSRKSPSLDKRDLYNRLDTGRWHEKAKEFEKERGKLREGERDVSRSQNRVERGNRSASGPRESRHRSRGTKEERPPKKMANRVVSSSSSSSATRRKDSPETTRSRAAYDSGRRTTVIARKPSPRDERLGRHDERRLDLKVTRRNDVRSGDPRDINLRVAREIRDRKEPPSKLSDKGSGSGAVGGGGGRERERLMHREIVDHQRTDRERSGKLANEERFGGGGGGSGGGNSSSSNVKERDKRVPPHDRLELRSGLRDLGDDARLSRHAPAAGGGGPSNERVVGLGGRVGSVRHLGHESVFDRMRNRYNDRRNAAENQRLGVRERLPVVDMRKERPLEKELPPPLTLSKGASRIVDVNGAVDRLGSRDRRPNVASPTPLLRLAIGSGRSSPPPPTLLLPLARSLSVHRDRKEPERNAVERRSPASFDRKFSSPLNSRRSRDLDTRVTAAKRRSVEHDDPEWARKKGMNKTRSRSRSSEKRKRRRSSQEEWRVIDMTSPVLDDEFSDENDGTIEGVQNKLKRSVANKLKSKIDDADDDDDSKPGKAILTDELSDISDEDFNDVNSTNALRNKKEVIATKNDRVIKSDEICRKVEQKVSNDRDDSEFEKTTTSLIDNHSNKLAVANDVDELIGNEKLTDEENERVDIEKGENFDSEEDTVSRVSDALGVDWADLVEESKKKATSNGGDEQNASNVRRCWNTSLVFAKVGVSEKYAGEDVFGDIRIELDKEVANGREYYVASVPTENSNTEDSRSKIFHKMPALHTCLKIKAVKRQTLFEPYKTAISARKDIAIRRRLCGLPVKNLPSQQMIGICHWIV